MPKQNVPYKCLSLIMLKSVSRVNKKYYPQTFLEECKYGVKNNRNKYIDYDFDTSSSDESDSEPDSESDNESDNESEKPSKKSDTESDRQSDNKFEKFS